MFEEREDRIVALPKLIQMKLVAGRYQHLADVVNLVRENQLDESFQQKLDPSVRGAYLACLAEKRRDDEVETRLDSGIVGGGEA